MRSNLTNALLFVLMLFFTHQSMSQNHDSIEVESDIRLKNPYGRGKTEWLNNNGFNTATYNWNDPVINLCLDQTIKNRSAGNALGFTSLGVFALGLSANALGRLAHEIGSSKPEEPYILFSEPYYLGGTLAVASAFFHIKAQVKLKRAKQLR